MKRICLAVLLLSTPAFAQDAKDKYKEGLVHYKVKEYKEAIAKFKEAYKLEPDPAYLYNIAQAYRLQGDCVDAASFYKTFIRDTTEGTTNRDKAARFQAEMETCIADGKSVDAPEVTVAREPDPEPEPDPQPDPDPQPEPEPDPEPVREPEPGQVTHQVSVGESGGSAGMRYGGIATSAVGLISVGVGVYFGMEARSATAKLSDALEANGGMWTDELESDERAAQRNEKLGAALTIGGAIATLGGGVLWYLGRDKESSAPSVTLLPREGGATLSWTSDF